MRDLWEIFLFIQLFVERISAIDVTQLSTALGSASKKRRIESGWGLLRDATLQSSSSYSVVPWSVLRLCPLFKGIEPNLLLLGICHVKLVHKICGILASNMQVFNIFLWSLL